jgi:hypothetical protein
MYLFARRRALQANEPWMQAFIVVASVQFSFALVVNIAFAIISVAQSATGEYTGLLTFADAKLWGNVLVYSLTPAVALFAWVASGRLGLGTAGTTLVICVAAGISFCGSQFAFEAISTFRGYYWHQMVLGSFITMSYGLAALLAGSVLPWKPMQEAPSIRSRFFGASPVPYEG